MGAKEGRSYAADYYERHKEEIAERKRERYRTDPEYRSKVREYQRKMARKRKLLEGGKQDYVGAPRGKKMVLVIEEREHIVEMFSVQTLCRRSGIKRATLRSWEVKGWMPRPTYVNAKGHLVYTEFEFWAIHKAIQRRRFQLAQKALSFKADDKFRAMIAEIYLGLNKGLPHSFFEEPKDTQTESDDDTAD
jgi:hypothetical protein